MINSFLVTLTNTGTQPTNPSSAVGDVLWPANVQVKAYAGAQALVYQELFGGQTNALHRFLTAIQLLWTVEESVLVDTILSDDPRITYTSEQLLGQFENTPTYDRQQITRILQYMDDLPVTQFLTGERLEVYRSALSKLDRLSAIICQFGLRDG